jgi:hypothetical protein
LNKLTSADYDLIVIVIEDCAFIFGYLLHGGSISGISKLYEIIIDFEHTFIKFAIIGD